MKHSPGFRIPFILGFVLFLLALLVAMAVFRPFQTSSARGKTQQRVVQMVVIETNGAIRLNDELVAGPEDQELLGLRDRLKEEEARHDGKNPVAILPQPDVTHARVVEVLNICSVSGIRNVFLRATDRKFHWRFKLRETPPPPSMPELHTPMETLIAIDADGTVRLNNQVIGSARDQELTRLRRKLKEVIRLFGENTPIILVPNPDIHLARISDVVDACSNAGAKNVSLGGNWSVTGAR
jgi:biopolymer transport protein ExbD